MPGMTIFTFLVLGASLIASVLGDPPVTIPLSKRGPYPGGPRERWEAYKAARLQKRLKNPSRRMLSRPKWLQDRAVAPSVNFTGFFDAIEDIAYTLNITVGTPPQHFLVQADTGSADFWLAAPGSVNTSSPFDPTSSSTHVEKSIPLDITYGDGTSFHGTEGTDLVSLGGLSVPNAIVSSGVLTEDTLGIPGATGLIGLAWTALSVNNNPTFVEQLVNMSKLEDNIFSVYLGRSTDIVGTEGAGGINGSGLVTAGSFTLGGVDPSTYTGDVMFFPILQELFWSVDAEGLVVNGTLLSGTTNLEAIMDSGTSLTSFPDGIFNGLATALGGHTHGDTGQLIIDCTARDALPTLALRIGGRDFAFAPEDLLAFVVTADTPDLVEEFGLDAGRTACVLALSTTGAEDGQIVMGDAFLKAWTSVYDFGNKRVGLAASSPPSNFTSVADVIKFKLEEEAVASTSTSDASGTSTSTGAANTSKPKKSFAYRIERSGMVYIAVFSMFISVGMMSC